MGEGEVKQEAIPTETVRPDVKAIEAIYQARACAHVAKAEASPDKARYWAVALTELEKVVAWVYAYCDSSRKEESNG